MTPTQAQSGWPLAAGALLLLVALAALGYRDTVLHVIDNWNQWRNGEYYAHGYLAVLLSAFLILRERRRLLLIPPCPQPAALSGIAACSLLWMTAGVTGVLLVQTALLLPLVLFIIWTTLGPRITRDLFVPVFILFFAMPVWAVFTPLLQDFTVHVVYALTRLAGIPAMRSNYLIVLPSGQLAIEESCSGLSYLLAALTLGMLYGYLNYRRTAARLAVVVISGAAAILANILRVFIVVVVGYRTEMQHPLIYHHFNLGWYLFGGLVLVLLVLDMRLQRRLSPASNAVAEAGWPAAACRYSMWQRAGIYGIAGLLVISGPLLSRQLEASQGPAAVPTLRLPAGTDAWHGPAVTDDRWSPVFHGANDVMRVYYRGNTQVFVYLGFYSRQRQGRELVFDLNRISDDRYWKQAYAPARVIERGGSQVTETRLVSTDGQQRLVWYWYRVAGHHTTGRLIAKLWQALGLVTNTQQAAVIALAADVVSDMDTARATLQQFLAAMGPALARAADGSSIAGGREGR